jgi:POT family proton-dependent oligopeptide transporter
MQKIKLFARATVGMTIGFVLTAASMAIATGVQQAIYNAPPCFNRPLECPASLNGSRPNNVSVMLQIPIYIIGAFGEMLWSVSRSFKRYPKFLSIPFCA